MTAAFSVSLKLSPIKGFGWDGDQKNAARGLWHVLTLSYVVVVSARCCVICCERLCFVV